MYNFITELIDILNKSDLIYWAQITTVDNEFYKVDVTPFMDIHIKSFNLYSDDLEDIYNNLYDYWKEIVKLERKEKLNGISKFIALLGHLSLHFMQIVLYISVLTVVVSFISLTDLWPQLFNFILGK